MANYLRPCKDKLIRLDGLLSVERKSRLSDFIGTEWRVELTYAGGHVVVIDRGILSGDSRSQEILEAIENALGDDQS